MKSIHTTAIIGAGALGCMYGQAIQSVLGDNLCYLTGNDRYKTMKQYPLDINGREVFLNARRPEDLESKPDLILLCVKNYNMEAVLPLLTEACGPQTIIVSVLNGIDSELLLEKAVPRNEVLYCAVLGMDSVKEGRTVRYQATGKFLLGTKNNTPSDSLHQVTDLLDKSGLAWVTPPDIHRAIWTKWMINLGINQVSAVTGTGYGAFQNQGEARDLMNDAMREAILLAERENVRLTEEDMENWYKVLATLRPEGKTSMVQDMEAGRKTELESFSGLMIKMAEKHNLELPVNKTLYRIIKTKEEMNTPS